MKTLGQIAREALFTARCDSEQGDWEAATQAVRAAVIEECAKVCESDGLIGSASAGPAWQRIFAEAIRALKDKP
jgi:hypothetical protein